MKWFRFYAEAVSDPKVQLLSPDLFKTWVNILCIACTADGGVLPNLEAMAYTLHAPVSKLRRHIDALVSAELLDNDPLRPHNWDKRQYKSDVTDPTAPERMRRYREKRNAGRNDDTAVIRPDTDTEETQKRIEKIYRFTGKVIRLAQADYDSWKQAYHAIPDLEAELFRIDQALHSQGKREGWFIAASNMLNAKHQKLLAEKPPERASFKEGRGVID